MASSTERPRVALGIVLARLRTVLQEQANALSAEDFEGLERLYAERERLVVVLDRYAPADLPPQGRALLEQIQALDQRLLVLARDSLDRTAQEMRDVQRGRGALIEYRRRGETLIQNLAQLDLEG